MCSESVRAVIRADSDFETKSKIFDYKWLFDKVKTIVSGLDTKVNLCVSLHDVVLNYIILNQQSHESNDGYLMRIKSMIKTLKITGGEHVLISPVLLGKVIANATVAELHAEKEQLWQYVSS